MKKVIFLLVLFTLIFSTMAYAVVYGARITRIETFPGEKVREEVEQAKAEIGLQNEEAILKLDEITATITQLQTTVDKFSADSASARTETNVQLSNILNAINNLKAQVDEIRDVKNLRTELPPLLEQPREIITPKVLLYLSFGNIFLALVLIVLVGFVRREHEVTHKMTPHGHPELHEYIRQHIKKGVHINTIRHQLVSHDWDPDEVDQAVREVQES